MAYLQYSDITGKKILQHVGLPNLGKYSESEIDLNKTNQGERASVIGLAVLEYDKIFGFASVDRAGLTSIEEADYDASLLWYIAYKLKDRSNKEAPKGSCGEDDYRACHHYKNWSCEHLKKASPEAHKFADWCESEACNSLSGDAFGVEVYEQRCGEWQE